MRKQLIATLVAALSLGSLAGPAMAEFKTRNIRLSNGLAPDHPVADGVRAFNACLNEKSGGKTKITPYWSGSLGDDIQAVQSLRSGVQEAVIPSSSPLVGLVPALGVFDLPFLFQSEAQADAILDGEFGQFINKKFEDVGIVNLAYWENGFRQVSNSKRPITKWEDFDGLKIRVMQNNIFLDTFQNMGANASPMAFSEIFSALETNAIDAQENPYVTIDTSKFYEVQKYVSETNHAYTPFLVLFSKRLFDRYSPEEQAALRECAQVGGAKQREVQRDLSVRSLATIKGAGLEVNQLTDEEKKRMREKAQVVYDKHKSIIGAEVVDRVQQSINTWNAAAK